jgi:hypothetical protein
MADAKLEAPMIAPVSTPNISTSFPGLNPGPGTWNLERETGNREQGTVPVDVLWSSLRDLADDLLRSRAVTLCRPIDERLRGEAYVYITDLIAGWVDRAERGDAGGKGLDPERMMEEGMTRLWLRINGPGRHRT